MKVTTRTTLIELIPNVSLSSIFTPSFIEQTEQFRYDEGNNPGQIIPGSVTLDINLNNQTSAEEDSIPAVQGPATEENTYTNLAVLQPMDLNISLFEKNKLSPFTATNQKNGLPVQYLPLSGEIIIEK